MEEILSDSFCPDCGNKMVVKFWGRPNVRYICKRCGHTEIKEDAYLSEFLKD